MCITGPLHLTTYVQTARIMISSHEFWTQIWAHRPHDDVTILAVCTYGPQGRGPVTYTTKLVARVQSTGHKHPNPETCIDGLVLASSVGLLGHAVITQLFLHEVVGEHTVSMPHALHT